MDIRSLDLNLLVVFDAMVEHRNVTRAAEAVGLSQPAMSAAVGRLRTLFDDPLFVKTGLEMRPTPRASELAEPVRLVIGTVKNDILRTQPFEPATAQRTFTLVAPDIAEIKLLPSLLARFETEAPRANLRTLAMPRHAAAEALESGAAELAVGYFPDLRKAGYYQQKLFSAGLACVVRRDHPTIGASLSLKQYMAASHALVLPEGRGHMFDQTLQERGLKRRVVLEISHYMSLMPVIEGTDLVATVPQDLAELFVRHAAVRMLPVPVKSPAVEVMQYWHGRFHRDPGNVWLRGVLHELFGA